jgi:hypothetical protein
MTLREKLQKAWDNRSQIAEGIYNTYLSLDPEIKAEAARRLEICQANTCGLWDSTGTSPKLVIQGKPGCTGCGCEGTYKVNCMKCWCSLKDIGQPPLWDAITTEEMDKEIAQKQWEEQFKNK